MTAHTETQQEQPQACTRQDYSFGGQAVLEGVMMRGRHAWGVAVRRPSGDIARMAYPLVSVGERSRILRFPVIRGIIALGESLSLGIKALRISANISLEEQLAVSEADIAIETGDGAAQAVAAIPVKSEEGKTEAFGKREMGVTVMFSALIVVGLFIVVPLVAAKAMGDLLANPILFNLFEGVVRLILFIGYLLAVQLIPDLRRVWEYHGAEHKLIHAYEASGRADPVFAQTFSTKHPRCGTGFLLLVFVLAVLLFAVIGKPALYWLVLSRIIGIPIIIGIGYELGIKWAGRSKRLWAKILLWPGIQLQHLTTREPSLEQLEVAAAALEEVIAMDQAEIARKAAPAVS